MRWVSEDCKNDCHFIFMLLGIAAVAGVILYLFVISAHTDAGG